MALLEDTSFHVARSCLQQFEKILKNIFVFPESSQRSHSFEYHRFHTVIGHYKIYIYSQHYGIIHDCVQRTAIWSPPIYKIFRTGEHAHQSHDVVFFFFLFYFVYIFTKLSYTTTYQTVIMPNIFFCHLVCYAYKTLDLNLIR